MRLLRTSKHRPLSNARLLPSRKPAKRAFFDTAGWATGSPYGALTFRGVEAGSKIRLTFRPSHAKIPPKRGFCDAPERIRTSDLRFRSER